MNIGDIVVRIKGSHLGMVNGDMGEIKSKTTPKGTGVRFDRWTSNTGGEASHAAENMRMADELEIAAYKQGITNIKDIPKDFQTTFIPLIWN